MTTEEILKNSYVVTNGGERLEQFRRTFEAAGLAPLPKVWNACMIPGEGKLGNAVSQYSLVRMAREAKLPFLVVFEDDAVPSDDAAQALTRAFNLRKPDCLCLTLGWNYDSDPESGDDIKKKRKVYGSHAYVLFGEKAYDAYLAKWPENGGADIVIARMDGARRNDEKIFEQHTVGPALHLPQGWAADQQIAKQVGDEIVRKWSKAREVVAQMKQEKAVHVAWCIDIQGDGAAQFGNQLYVSVKSVRDTRKPGDEVVAHVCYSHVSVELMERLHALDAEGFEVVTRHITDQDLAFWQQFTRHDPRSAARPWGGIVFARIWLPLLLPDIARCVYLDADTMCRAPIAELAATDLKGKWLGMNIGSVPEYGYNSGVMVMDLAAMREDKTLYQRLGEHMAKFTRGYFCPDQTTINRFFADKIADIPREWNFPPTVGSADPEMRSAKLWHFYNGGTKPYRIAGDDFGRALVAWNNVLSAGEKQG